MSGGRHKKSVPVDKSKLRTVSVLISTDFSKRGTYEDKPFTCKDCGKEEIWTATQQKWWYEIAGGEAYSGAVRCRPCRKREYARKAQVRKVHLEGMAAKGKQVKKSERKNGQEKS